MIKYKYVFKTQEEFFNQYGPNWVDIVNWNDSGDMDNLFGIDVPYDDYKDILNNSGKLNMDSFQFRLYTLRSDDGYAWYICPKMVKEVKIGVDYNTPKILVYD